MSFLNYYLGPWVWDDSDPAAPFYRAPTGTLGLVDLRPVAPVLTMGFFATNVALGSDYESFGDGINRLEDVALTPQQRSIWSSALGIGAIVGNRLIDALWETLTVQADPDGGVICPPLMPTHRGVLELHLGGHSLIRSEQFTGPGHPAWPKIQALMQRNYRSIHTEAMRNHRGGPPPDVHSKYLECMRRKLRCPWELLIPPGLPQEPPRRPSTSVSDDFNRANGALGANWTETLNGGHTIVSNRARSAANDAISAYTGTPLSSDDQYSIVTAVADTHGYGAVRTSVGASGDAYGPRFRPTLALIEKWVAGMRSTIASNAASLSFPLQSKMTADGSSLSALADDVEQASVTDTALSGIVYAGLASRNSTIFSDNFEAADLVAAGESRPLSGPFKGPLGGPFG